MLVEYKIERVFQYRFPIRYAVYRRKVDNGSGTGWRFQCFTTTLRGAEKWARRDARQLNRGEKLNRVVKTMGPYVI